MFNYDNYYYYANDHQIKSKHTSIAASKQVNKQTTTRKTRQNKTKEKKRKKVK
jgi:hypothetical protein